jgi:hypothetical protein
MGTRTITWHRDPATGFTAESDWTHFPPPLYYRSDMQQDVFLRFIFGNNSGYVCVAIIKHSAAKGKAKEFREFFFQYPEQKEEMGRCIEEFTPTHNVYFCPQLLDSTTRDKAHIKSTHVIWADLDSCPPGNMLIPPSIVIETSPKRFQAYWKIDDASPVEAEQISQRIAYFHEREGADKGGWDLSQLLRVPFTYNLKPEYDKEDPPQVKVYTIKSTLYRKSDFLQKYPAVTRTVAEEFEFPKEFPNTTGLGLLDKYGENLPPQIEYLFHNTPDKGSWSTALWTLQLLCLEAGMSREETYLVSRDASCNKFKRDHRDHEHLLWRDVCRAYVRNEENIKVIAPDSKPLPKLLSPEERAVAESRNTFVERYIQWASSLGDAAPQYHQAGAFVILSSVLSGGVRLPTSFGTIKPNIWFMILADTTLTRKTTAMDIAMDLVTEVDDGCVLATDGSVEGLLGTLALRPGRPSVFLRDEFSGLLESIVKKDHYAGMAEMFTKLYDGKMQKRVLRKETISVADPVLVMFTGGIRSKVCGILTHEHIGSGFIPRFVFVTAESDLSKVQPLGPPTERDSSGRDEILQGIRRLADVYAAEAQYVNTDGVVKLIPPAYVKASLSPAAWQRYNQLESEMMQEGLRSQAPEIMTPTFDRLCKSILKAAVLISASRQDPTEDRTIQVSLEDILHAILYGEGWRDYGIEIINNIGKNTSEQQLEKIANKIYRAPGITRSQLMQNYHLNSREASLIFETLEQRGIVLRTKEGRTEKFFPNPNVKRKATV